MEAGTARCITAPSDNPTLSTLLAVLHGLDLRLQVVAEETDPA